ncbi:MAG: hypothetical protein MPEBLZ_00891 [Candidatus Methanoperedens nitroreducens]|uniref:Uncharacterized protein n=1 Tax=Candidatus Methanoperedens nitratireducens TaxID=1392998 RepID=A0A0P8AIT4_9EURY|nr:MAG: hypothetical protein MPEBLZ_00891 [Candidatus Methanoperedens sp. BLZ1]
MDNDNKALFTFGFVFYFIGDLATTYIGLNNGVTEKGFIRVIGNPGLADMVIIEADFFHSPIFSDRIS